MFLPSEYTWFEPVLIAAIIVFIIDLIGSMLVFSRRPMLNALASAIVFAVIFGVLVYYGYGRVEMSVSTTPAPTAPAQSPPTTSAPTSE
jgi:drug/metabolite transporter (DMT)-like permease